MYGVDCDMDSDQVVLSMEQRSKVYAVMDIPSFGNMTGKTSIEEFLDADITGFDKSLMILRLNDPKKFAWLRLKHGF